MQNRITCVAGFDKKSSELIEQTLNNFNINNLCKVPFNIENRVLNDTLPYHITLSAWNIAEEPFVTQELKKLKLDRIKTNFIFSIMDSSIKGKILYLKPLEDEGIKSLQRKIFNILPTERYNPNKYTIHSTVCIDDDLNRINDIYHQVNHTQLELAIDSVCLFKIYPAELIAKI